jgi:hypothetical protein
VGFASAARDDKRLRYSRYRQFREVAVNTDS